MSEPDRSLKSLYLAYSPERPVRVTLIAGLLRNAQDSTQTTAPGPIDIQDSNRLGCVAHEFPESNPELAGWQSDLD